MVVALLLLVAWDFAPRALGTTVGAVADKGAGLVNTISAAWPLWLIAVLSLIATVRFNVHPVPLIVGGAIVGLLFGLGS